jgi:hypothetical protein
MDKKESWGHKRCIITHRSTAERARVYYNHSYTQYNIIINCYSECLNSDQNIIKINSKITKHVFETNE